MACKHRTTTGCALGLYGGRPSAGTCAVCPQHSGIPRGVGDVVHIMAQPVAAMIDVVAGTNIKHCPGCAKRRQLLNQRLPFGATNE